MTPKTEKETAAAATAEDAACTTSHNNNNNDDNTKRKNGGDDVLSRLDVGPQGGRGSQTGWTVCPLCVGISKKRFALGRGIAAHLHAVHTPWNAGTSKIERRKRKRRIEQQERQQRLRQAKKKRRKTNDDDDEYDSSEKEKEKEEDEKEVSSSHSLEEHKADESSEFETETCSTCWEPTQDEIDTWNAKVMEIVQKLDAEATTATSNTNGNGERREDQDSCTGSSDSHQVLKGKSNNNNNNSVVGPGYDRTGQPTTTYRRSLPPFIQAAADGDLETIQRMVKEKQVQQSQAQQETTSTGAGASAVLELVHNTRDRHGSIAEHWAAGGGHVHCLKYLLELTSSKGMSTINESDASSSSNNNNSNNPEVSTTTVASSSSDNNKKKIRRRDGKTSLHYAARNGRIDCLRYLLEGEEATNNINYNYYDVNERTGDGTTPLHLACFGGHVDAVEYLLRRGADPTVVNDWGCSAAHWTALMKTTERKCCGDNNNNKQNVYRLCRMLQDHGVSFIESQKQGHTALHKAAQKRNQSVIEWIVGSTKGKGGNAGAGAGAGLSKKELRMASQPDDGGHRPSDIWIAAGGDEAFASWMRQEVEQVAI